MRFHYPQIDIEDLNDEDWYELIDEYMYVQKLNSQRFKADMREVLYELATAIYGKK